MKRTLILCMILSILTALAAADDLMGFDPPRNNELPTWESVHTWGEGTITATSGDTLEGEDLDANQGILLCSEEFILIFSDIPGVSIYILVF